MPRKITVQDWRNMGKQDRYDAEKQIVETPDALYEAANAEFDFGLDAAAIAENAKHENYITPEEDTFTVDWKERSDGKAVWMNPPYGFFVTPFIEKAYTESQKGVTVVILTYMRCDSEWWEEWVGNKAHEVRNIVGRIKFKGMDNSGFFPSCLIIYRGSEPFTDTKLVPWYWRETRSTKRKKKETQKNG